MPQSMNVTVISRSMATKNFIDNALSGQKSLKLQSHMGDLQTVNGKVLSDLSNIDLLLVDLDTDNQEEMSHLSRIANQQRGKTAIVVTAADITNHGIRGLIRQGVDDFVPQPLESGELLDAVEGARIKLKQVRAEGGLGQVIAVGRAKGGMGATTLALHTAIALTAKKRRRDPARKVALLDLDLHFGDIGMLLDMKPNEGFDGILRDPSRLDDELLQQAMTEHKSGMMVLQAPVGAVPLDSMRSESARRLIELAREEFDYVVIDLPLALPRWLEAVLQQVDHFMMVTQLNVPAVRQTRRLIDLLSDEGLFDMPVSIVLNRYVWHFGERGRVKQAVRALGQPFAHYVPNDYELVLDAMNRGLSLFDVRKRSKLCRAIQELTKDCVINLEEKRAAASRAATAG